MRVSMLYLWLKFGCNWSLYGKEMEKCNQFYICSHFYIYILTSDDLWPWYVTFDLINIWRFPCCIYDQSLVTIGHCMEKKWTNVINFTYAATFTYTSWPRMTFDLGMWPLTSLTYEGSHVASMTEVWLQLDIVWKRNGKM